MLAVAIFTLSIWVSPPAQANAGLLAPASACKNQGLKAGPSKARKAMICMTNFARTKSGLMKYREIKLLDQTAAKKAADIIRCKSFSHEACGRNFTFWQEKLGYLDAQCWSAGENIAWGSSSLGTVRSIFNAWMHSQSHRAAILNTAYTEIGVGQKRGRFEGYSGSSIWVQHFGHRTC